MENTIKRMYGETNFRENLMLFNNYFEFELPLLLIYVLWYLRK